MTPSSMWQESHFVHPTHLRLSPCLGLSPTCGRNFILFVEHRCARTTNKMEFLPHVSGGVEFPPQVSGGVGFLPQVGTEGRGCR